MPDLLTHVLVGYALATLLTLAADWPRAPYVTAAMVGAALPDLDRIELVVPASTVEAASALALDAFTGLTGVGTREYVPFNWGALHTLPASLLVAACGALLVPARHRRRVLALLVLGAASHHALDLLLVNPDGHSYPVLWPLSAVRLETPGLYSSRDGWPLLVAALGAGVARLLRDRAAPAAPTRQPDVPE